MSKLYDCVLQQIFKGFLTSNEQLLQQLTNTSDQVLIANGCLVFTLPNLYSFAQAWCGAAETSYVEFRKELYTQPTNTWLRQWGGVVEIEKPSDVHENTVYKLARI
jgi:hypothetical protein